MAFTLSEQALSELFTAANFAVPDGEMVLFGIRGCSPLNTTGTDFATSHQLEFVRVDYRHMNCTLGQWVPGSGFAVFPGSTVPHLSAVRRGRDAGGRGVNQLALGYFTGPHRYYKGDHKLANPNRRHRALRNDSPLPVWRNADDEDYEGDDLFEYEVVYDNIHCAYQMNVEADVFSSDGCQVVAGRPKIPPRGWDAELGPWAGYIGNVYGRSQHRFSYGLFAGHEAVRVAGMGSAGRAQTVRFGSTGALVQRVQEALRARGFDTGGDPAGSCGIGTVRAIRLFQRGRFGPSGVDLIVGPGTGAELGIPWPQFAMDGTGEETGAISPLWREGAGSPGTAAAPAAHGPNYRSLAGGFFSDDPFDLSVRRAIRTNNPGALNISQWQRTFPGFVGQTQPDSVGNKTSIYVTPEHGSAAWYHLLTDRYGYGRNGRITPRALAKKYAGVNDDNSPAVRTYLAGWRRWSNQGLTADTQIKLDDRGDVLLLARAMFCHEIGAATPLTDDQIWYGVEHLIKGDLPST